MSYEGYYVYYCENGHKVITKDAYDSPPDGPCPICKSKEYLFDSIDLTNGCECEYLTQEERDAGIKCACHEEELDIIGWSPDKCPDCRGIGIIELPMIYKDELCSCLAESAGDSWGDPVCPECFGTGNRRIADSRTFIKLMCPECKGTGLIYTERYDIDPLRRSK